MISSQLSVHSFHSWHIGTKVAFCSLICFCCCWSINGRLDGTPYSCNNGNNARDSDVHYTFKSNLPPTDQVSAIWICMCYPKKCCSSSSLRQRLIQCASSTADSMTCLKTFNISLLNIVPRIHSQPLAEFRSETRIPIRDQNFGHTMVLDRYAG